MFSSTTNSCDTYQDSYIAISTEGIVVDHCSVDADVSDWMLKNVGHFFLITSTAQAHQMLGFPLPEGDVDVMLL